MSEIAALKTDIDTLRNEVNGQLTGVRSDIKDLTKVLRDLIRMDGEIKNIATLVGRVAGEVDDHEQRLRSLEKSSAINSIKIGQGERLYWLIGSGVMSAIVGVTVFVVSH